MTVSRQAVGTSWTYDYQGTELIFTDYLTSVWYNSAGQVKDNTSYMVDPLIFTAMKDKNDGHIDILPSSDDYGPLEGFGFIGSDSTGDYSWNYGYASKMPGTLTKPEAGDDSPVVKAAYGDFVGQWNAGGNVLTITANADNATYSIVGFPGQDLYDDVTGAYNETDGTLVVMEQDLGVWTHETQGSCSDFLGGVFVYGGTEYTAYPFSCDEKSVAFTAQLKESGSMVFAPGSCEYGTFVGVNLGFIITNKDSAYYGYGDTEDVFYFDVTAKPVSTSTAFNAPKSHGKKAAVRTLRFTGSRVEKASATRPAKQAKDTKDTKNERAPKRNIQF